MRRVILICSLVLVVSFYVTNVYAMCGMCSASGAHAADESGSAKSVEKSKVVKVDNKTCPVTGEIIKEEAKVQHTHDGKIYSFCCPMCIDEFKKDPQKYIKKIETQKAQENKTKKSKPQEEHQHSH